MNIYLKKAVVLFVSLLACTTIFAAGKSYNVLDFGAEPSLTEVCTESIQAAIDAANEDGGGTVIFPAGAYTTGTIFLKSNVTIKLDQGVEIFGSSNYERDYAEVPLGTEEPHFSRCLFYALGVENVTIIGAPTSEINGKGYFFKHAEERPKLFRIEESQNILFEDLIVKNSGSWCLYFRECDHIRLNRCKVYNKENKNNDGMNYDGCSDVRIIGCNLQVEDDAICLKSSVMKPCEDIHVEDCTVSSVCACFKLGTASMSVFKNITVKNCRFYDAFKGAIKILIVDGGSVENVLIEDVECYNCGGPIFMRLGNRGRDYTKSIKQIYAYGAKPEGRPVGTLKDVTIRNIKARVTGYTEPPFAGMLLLGHPGHYIENVTFENFDFSFVGQGETGNRDFVPEEHEADYPEQHRFGLLPCYGMYARHIKGLKMSNVNFTLRDNDDRHAIVMDDVVDSEFSNFTVDSAIGKDQAVDMIDCEGVKFKKFKVNNF